MGLVRNQELVDSALRKYARKVFFAKINEYNAEYDKGALQEHRSRYVRLNDKYVLLIIWRKGWSHQIYEMEVAGDISDIEVDVALPIPDEFALESEPYRLTQSQQDGKTVQSFITQ